MTTTLQRLTAQGRALVQRVKPQSASVRNVLKLTGGTAGSQVITVAALPILTRLYGPESFGLLATFVSSLALLNVVSSMSYELAIPVPDDDEEAIQLFWLCLFFISVFSAWVAFAISLFGNTLVNLSNQPGLSTLLWLIPVGTFFIGLYTSLNYWAIRSQRFGALANTKLIQSISGQTCSILLSPLGPSGLAIGSIVSQSFGSIRLVNKSLFSIPHCQKSKGLLHSYYLHLPRILKLARKYYQIAINNTIARLLNTVYPFLIAVVLSKSGEVSALGLLFLVQRILDAPSSLISRAIGDEFLSRVSRVEEEKIYVVCLSNIKIISAIASIFFVAYGFFILFFAEKIFGSFWSHDATILAFSLIPSTIIQLSVGSTGMVFVTSNRNFHGLIAQALMLIFRALPILFCVILKETHALPLMYALGMFLGYFSYGAVLMLSLKK
jgi:O-antigen/teichoic acid export membrane protein